MIQRVLLFCDVCGEIELDLASWHEYREREEKSIMGTPRERCGGDG